MNRDKFDERDEFEGCINIYGERDTRTENSEMKIPEDGCLSPLGCACRCVHGRSLTDCIHNRNNNLSDLL